MTYSEIIKFIVAMTIMINPLSSLSVFLQFTNKFPPLHQRHIAKTTMLAITIIMIVPIWTGKDLLELLGITIPSFRFAGGLILLTIGFSMLQSRESAVNHTTEDDEAAKERHSIAVVPLALPIIIGPGAITTLIIASGDFPQLISKTLMTVICLGLGLGMGVIMYFGNPIANFVGTSVMKVVTRIMGMIIMAIAVGMLADGISGLFPLLQSSAPKI
jgi:multiple antibiotic resistance protein